MVREYIVKIADDVTEDDDVLYGKPAKELIRCKDCKHWHNDGILTKCDRLIGNGFPADWFCADGERKDGDGDADGATPLPG